MKTIIIPKYKPNPEIFSRLREYLKDNAQGFEIIEMDGTKGLANAYNEGIKKAKGDIIITLHQDCIPLEEDAINKLVEPFKNPSVVLSYSWIMEEDIREKYYPFFPDGKFTAFRKSALEKVGLFDEKHFIIGGEDVDIYLNLREIGDIVKVNTGLLHIHSGYKTNKSKEKIKQNGNINGTLFRLWGFKYSKWHKALILCLIYPFSYGKQFIRGFINKKQDYRRNE